MVGNLGRMKGVSLSRGVGLCRLLNISWKQADTGVNP